MHKVNIFEEDEKNLVNYYFEEKINFFLHAFIAGKRSLLCRYTYYMYTF